MKYKTEVDYDALEGRVQLPKGHPWFGERYEDLNQVSRYYPDLVRKLEGGAMFLAYADPDTGWIGFTTDHAWDVWEGELGPLSTKWDYGKLREQTAVWAELVAEAAK